MLLGTDAMRMGVVPLPPSGRGSGLGWGRRSWFAFLNGNEDAIDPNRCRDALVLDRHQVTVAVAGPDGTEPKSPELYATTQ